MKNFEFSTKGDSSLKIYFFIGIDKKAVYSILLIKIDISNFLKAYRQGYLNYINRIIADFDRMNINIRYDFLNQFTRVSNRQWIAATVALYLMLKL